MDKLKKFEEDLLDEIDRLSDEMVKDAISLIEIPSKKAGSMGDLPFGADIQEALDKALEISKREGFNTKNVDNYMAYAYVGDTEDYIGIFGHLDVVDEGDVDTWTHPPYKGEIADGKIYGRGALDNKGPLMAAFYGLIALKNLGHNFNHQVRFIFGTDEESGMSDLKHYLSKEKPPIMGFVPDNKFPAIYGEMGRADLLITGDVDEFYESYLKDEEKILENLGLSYENQAFGKIKLKRLEKNEDGIRLVLSTPILSDDIVLSKVRGKAEGLNVELKTYYEPALKPADSLMVATLNKAYTDLTGENIPPTTTTGITYAHICPNVIGFGPSFPGQNGISHGPDEWIAIDDMIKMAKIYAIAIYRLDQLKNI